MTLNYLVSYFHLEYKKMGSALRNSQPKICQKRKRKKKGSEQNKFKMFLHLLGLHCSRWQGLKFWTQSFTEWVDLEHYHTSVLGDNSRYGVRKEQWQNSTVSSHPSSKELWATYIVLLSAFPPLSITLFMCAMLCQHISFMAELGSESGMWLQVKYYTSLAPQFRFQGTGNIQHSSSVQNLFWFRISNNKNLK